MSGPLSPSKQTKQSATHRLCKNAGLLAIGLAIFEVGFFMGRVGPNEPAGSAKKILLQPWNGTQPSRTPLDATATLPLSLRAICPMARGSADRAFHVEHKFSQPLLLHVYMRLDERDHNFGHLVMITTGVSMGTFRRNFSAAGCMVGKHVYPVDDFNWDRAICTVPAKIERGVPLTLVLVKDNTLITAIEGPVEIDKQFVAELEEGDVGTLDRAVVLHDQLEDYEHDELVPIRSKLVWENQMDAFDTTQYPTIPRYEFCVATQIKPSVHLLPDWVDYHRRIGFDFVYIFDNDAEEDLSAMFAHRHDVEVVYWPWEKSQIQSFTYSMFPMRARCEWLLLIDSDEYVMVGLGGDEDLSKRDFPPLKEYIRRKGSDGFVQIWFHWVIMKNSGHVTPPPNPVPEAYIHREDPQLNEGQIATLGKTMTQMDKDWINSNAHSRKANERAPTFNDLKGGMFPSDPSDTAMIVHFRKRSWIEYKDKLRFGRANINNPKTVSELEMWDKRSGDQFRRSYMQSGKKRSKVYTYFRSIWRRVTRELSIGTSVTVRYKDGKRCRTFYDLSRDNYEKPIGKEKCIEEVKDNL